MSKIAVLPPEVANQIAAGEVVERPASVIKELVENAIDAESTKVDVVFEEGGLKRIEVKDNGKGMEPEESVLAFKRHATSKIRRTKDLQQILTLGFRGEALPSIASVAQVELTTAARPGGPGTELLVSGEDIAQKLVVWTQGTRVRVTRLFYRTPARLKYLKSLQTETGHIQDVMFRLALSHPGIAFTLKHQERLLLSTAGDGNLLHVIHALYGMTVAKTMVSVEAEHPDFSLYGYLSKPETTRANRSYMTFIVNGRVIKNQMLYQAVLRAYHTLLPVKRFPVVVLAVQMDPQLLDVNVHPAKLEVRFSKEKELANWVEEEVRRALKRTSLVPEVKVPGEAPGMVLNTAIRQQIRHPAQVDAAKNGLEKDDYERRKVPSSAHSAMQLQFMKQPGILKDKALEPSGQAFPLKDLAFPVEEKSLSLNLYTASSGVQCATESPSYYTETAKQAEMSGKAEKGEQMPELAPLAQLHGTYILAQDEDGLYMVDQHAAQERLFYERFYRQIETEQVTSQPLLVPYTVKLNPREFNVMLRFQEALYKMGVEVETFGRDTFIVRSHPSWVPPEEEVYWLQEIFQTLFAAKGAITAAEVRDRAIMTMACKAAIKANRHLSYEEMAQLLADLPKANQPFTCPHGRPVMVHLSTYEIEKMFKRVM